jgi:GT2 family glycosyltransferase
MKRLCILIPVHNKLDYTKKCLADLKENLTDRFADEVRIVVIDDGSKDGTESWIHDNYPDVIVLHGNGELFWTGAINAGIKYAIYQEGYEFILLWNNDVIAEKNYFRNLFIIIQSCSEIVGSKILTLFDKRTVWSCGGDFNPHTGASRIHGNLNSDNESCLAIRSVDWCTGMGTLIHKKVVEKIGLMDNLLFPQYFGDTDYTYRAKVAGFAVRIHPDLILYNDTVNTGLRHNGSLRALFKSLVDIRSVLNLKAHYYFLKKHATSNLAYFQLFRYYFRVFGGFAKWKLLALFGLYRNSDRFYH